MTPFDEQRLKGLLDRLAIGDSLPESEFDRISVTPGEMGLVVRDGMVLLSPDTKILDIERIREGLSPEAAAWLRDPEVHLVIDSTNSRMTAAAQAGSVDGLCWFAELQTAGRGRRGRSWVSPFARNLTLSLGFSLGGTPRDAGALSLVVGLAVADMIEGHGVADVSLKWPNDVLVGGAKACGILIELIAHRRPLECVIGIGLNVEMPHDVRAAIGQDVADLREHGVEDGRDVLAAELVSAVIRYVDEFKRSGFRGMRSTYDEVHTCHGRHCRILHGNAEFEGVVTGVTDDGELRVRGPDGERRFNGGEVSLRRDV